MSHSRGSDDPIQAVKDVVGESTALIALAGTALAIVTSYIPFSPLLGGLLAGWLVRDDPKRGAMIGGLSGLILLVPFGLFGVLSFGLAFLDAATGFVFILFFLVAAAFGLVYTVGISALGGYLGVRFYQNRVGDTSRQTQFDSSTHRQSETDPRSTETDDGWGSDTEFGSDGDRFGNDDDGGGRPGQ